MEVISEGGFSIIVPVYQKPVGLVEECIKALLDQDYKNYEIIAVLDGPDDKANKMLKKYKEVKAFEIPHGGACRARNYGVEQAEGEYLVFMDADSILFPGALRTYKNAFDKNPDCEFVYGGYRLNTPEMLGYASEEFDAWRLTVENFITGSSPIRRKDFPGWDEAFKSLQDWDMWLTVVEQGGKGKFLNEYFFVTEMPDSKSVSGDSAANWVERVKQIKKKHNIPDRKICVSSLGAPNHALPLAKILDADYKQWVSRKPHNYDMVYSVGFYPFVADNQLRYPFVSHETLGKIEELGSFKKVIHWIGTDIWQMQQLKWQQVKDLVESFKKHKFIHLCEFEQTRKELADLGIDAKIVPLPKYKDWKVLPLPEKFTVAIYDSGKQAFDIYNSMLMQDVANSMPDIDFKFFGDEYKTHKEANTEYCGRVEMEEFLPKVSCNLRITVHDGLPMTPCEFVMSGRHAITSVQMPYMEHISNSSGFLNNVTKYPEIKRKIVEKIRELQDKKPDPEGAKYYNRLLDPQRYRRAIYGL